MPANNSDEWIQLLYECRAFLTPNPDIAGIGVWVFTLMLLSLLGSPLCLLPNFRLHRVYMFPSRRRLDRLKFQKCFSHFIRDCICFITQSPTTLLRSNRHHLAQLRQHSSLYNFCTDVFSLVLTHSPTYSRTRRSPSTLDMAIRLSDQGNPRSSLRSVHRSHTNKRGRSNIYRLVGVIDCTLHRCPAGAFDVIMAKDTRGTDERAQEIYSHSIVVYCVVYHGRFLRDRYAFIRVQRPQL